MASWCNLELLDTWSIYSDSSCNFIFKTSEMRLGRLGFDIFEFFLKGELTVLPGGVKLTVVLSSN